MISEKEIFLEEILKKKSAIEEYIKVAKGKLEEAELEKDEEGVATATFLVAEYETMLEEFCKYYRI